MTFKLLALAIGIVAALFGFQALSTRQISSEHLKQGRIVQAVEDAKAKGKSEVSISAPIPFYAQVNSLDEALANYSTVIAQPVLEFSKIDPDSGELETWYKLSVIEYLSQPRSVRCGNCSFGKMVPAELQPLQENEIAVLRNGGNIVLDGINVTSTERAFPAFKLNQKYLLFLSLDLNRRVGLIDLGQVGVSVVESDGQVNSIGVKNKVSDGLKQRFRTIDEVKRQLRFRRFPE